MSHALKKKRSAVSGIGLFALDPIEKGDYIIDYTGELISNDEAEKRGGKYLFELNSKWTLDGKDNSNLGRYINHCCKPNCETTVSGKRVKVFAIKNIAAGEELFYDYGKEYFEEFIKPFGCKCPACLGMREKKVKREKDRELQTAR